MKLQWKLLFIHLWLTFIFTECIYNRCSNVLCKVKNAIIRENQQTIPCEQHCFRVLLTGISADGCPSLREKRRIKKERQNMSNKQEKCKLQERGKLNVMTCGGGKVKRGEWRRSALCMMGSPPAAWVYKDGSASPDPALTTSCIQKERKDKASTCRVFSLSYSADCLLTVHQTLQNRPTSC